MSNKHLKFMPTHLTDLCWYYEEPKGLVICHEIHCDDCKSVDCKQFTISWRRVRAALKRKDRAEAEKGGENG